MSDKTSDIPESIRILYESGWSIDKSEMGIGKSTLFMNSPLIVIYPQYVENEKNDNEENTDQ